jgi:hypothetical protein
MRKATQALIVLVVFTSLVFAKKQGSTQHAPLPAKVLAAKTIYIQSDSGWAEAGDKAYTQLKAWGKYQNVDAKEKADMTLVLTRYCLSGKRDRFIVG